MDSTVYCKIGKAHLELHGNVLSGDTYQAKDFIKQCLAGKWDGNRKVWTVDTGKFDYYLDRIGSSLRTDDNPPATKAQTTNNGGHGFGWCNKCHSYCYGDCEANS